MLLPSLEGNEPTDRYVAFVDILGFGRRTLDDFDQIVGAYQQLALMYLDVPDPTRSVDVRLLSDAFILSAPSFEELLSAVQPLHTFALQSGCMIRGGIGFGRHLEAQTDRNYVVVSEALVRAVETERTISHPCVAIHPSVAAADAFVTTDPFCGGLLEYEGTVFVSPFNIMWGRTARNCARALKHRYPDFRAKYDWFLNVCERYLPPDEPNET